MRLANLLVPHKTISLIGMAKNAGKTTVLNHLIEEFKTQNIRLALTSIGRDGEDLDVVTFTPKPKIFVPAGTILATATELLQHCDISAKMLAQTPYGSALGDIVVVRAMSAGFVQLGGPSMTAQMAEILPILRDFGAEKIIVDGAISRKSIASPKIADAVVLCTGAALSEDIDEVVAETTFAAKLLSLRGKSAIPPAMGAITNKFVIEQINSGKDISGKVFAVDDATKILITRENYAKLQKKGASIAVANPISLAAVCINPTAPKRADFEAAEFLQKMQTALDIPVFDVLK